MKALVKRLRERPIDWIVPLVLVFGALAWLAWTTVRAPSSPLTYRIDF